MLEEIEAKSLTTNMFDKIADDWLLICTSFINENGKEKENLMTASWGGVGILWNKEVCFLFVRPQRYTNEIIEKSTRLAVCSIPERYRDAHKVCGRESGRDIDKFSKTGLTSVKLCGCTTVGEADFVMILKKIYVDRIDPNGIIDKTVFSNYPKEDYHYLYVCEIEKIFVEE